MLPPQPGAAGYCAPPPAPPPAEQAKGAGATHGGGGGEGRGGSLASPSPAPPASSADAAVHAPSNVQDLEIALPDTVAYVVSPHDVVVARSRSVDDRVGWLLGQEMLSEAFELAVRHSSSLIEHKLIDLTELQLGAMIAQRRSEPRTFP